MKKLLLIMGDLATGKSTFANILSKRYDINVNKQKVSYTEYVIGLIECLDTILKKYGGVR